jgi:hypothetical protein
VDGDMFTIFTEEKQTVFKINVSDTVDKSNFELVKQENK